MSYSEIWAKLLSKEGLSFGAAVIAGLLTLIQISPLKINPWGWLAKKIGKAVNGELFVRMDALEKGIAEVKEDVETTREESRKEAIISSRVRILRFGDELRRGATHSKDHFDQLMSDIDRYEKYCLKHTEFENNITAATIMSVKEEYRKLLKTNGFAH